VNFPGICTSVFFSSVFLFAFSPSSASPVSGVQVSFALETISSNKAEAFGSGVQGKFPVIIVSRHRGRFQQMNTWLCLPVFPRIRAGRSKLKFPNFSMPDKAQGRTGRE
jgi:hypothetical protein